MSLYRHLPNFLSYSRALLFVLVLYAVLNLSEQEFALYTFLILIYAALSDFLDGYAARKLQVVSKMGKIIDPIADKCVMLAVFAAYFVLDIMPFWIFILITLREVSITIVRLVWANQGRIVAAEWSGKVKTFVQFIYAIVTSIYVYFYSVSFTGTNLLIMLLMWLMFLLTLYSGLEFFLRNCRSRV